MKTMKLKGRKSIAALFTITAVFFLSCDNPIGLGAMLDLDGPMVEFVSPAPRQALLAEFDIDGIVSDKTGVDRMLLTAETTKLVNGKYETVTYGKQWRYEKGKWESSVNGGSSWTALPGARAAGPAPDRAVTNAKWSIPIDMRINGDADDGIYLFKIQAWDSGGFTGDNSTKTIVLIVDQHPPRVSVIDPYIYDRQSYSPATNTFIDSDLEDLHNISNGDESESRKSSNIGLFMTRTFDLKWQIDDDYDIGSIDIIFCDYDTDVDGDPQTGIDENKIYYRYHEDLPKPNGLTKVPNLTAAPGVHDGKDGEIVKTINQKTTIMVVAVCYDAAGNESESEEKTLGYFVYWPKADEPWIEYPSKMDDPYKKGYFTSPNNKIDDLKDKVLMVYPERSIKPAAYQAHGVSKVRYALYQCEEKRDDPNSPTDPTNPIRLTGDLKDPDYYKSVNKPREVGDNKILSTNFTWEITAPSRPGYYLVVAIPYGPEGYNENDASGRDNEGDADFVDADIEKFTALFRVQDISFPEFLPGYPLPSATEPLFKFIGRPEAAGEPDDVDDGEIRISGKVDDALQITSLLMVWINPASRNYSAMSQLRYFSDPAYEGWNDAAQLTEGTNDVEDADNNSTVENYPYDTSNRNRLWNLVVPIPVEDPDTYRQVYTYSQIIDLAADLNIGTGTNQKPLNSQMFLLRAQNPDGKATVISYAPQGDAAVPTIKIDRVDVGGIPYTPGQGFAQVPQFLDTDSPAKVITVNGTWEEDSTAFLDNWTYFYNNMVFSINGVTIRRNAAGTNWVDGNGSALNNITVTIDPPAGATAATKGSFTIAAVVGTENSTNTLKTSHLRDTLVVNASVRDYGGNPAENGASWLIESDKLRFLRISSLKEDQAYRAGDAIDIFIEFNKPVRLKSNRSKNPVLLVNAGGGTTTTGIAAYKTGQVSESTRYYFTYTVGTSDNTDRLNVTGISIAASNAALGNTNDWQNTDYPFTFVHTNIEGNTEEIRLTRNPNHVTSDASRNGVEITSTTNPGVAGTPFFARVVPVSNATTDPDYIYTLGGGKAISVDTTAPTITGITASPAGWHKAGVDLYITATFSEPIQITGVPRLTLTNGYQTTNDINDIRVNGSQITFRYTVAAGHTTGANALQVTNVSGGSILDIPGNTMAAFGTARTLTGVYIDTTLPATPTITVYSGTITSPGTSLGSGALGALYDDYVFIRITAGTGSTAGDNINLGRVEYSLNGGANWISSTVATTNIQMSNKGDYQVSVRQTDSAGNESAASGTTAFTWDPGTLITRISSTSANGTYTHNTGRNQINVTVTFRKNLTFTAATPTITHNAKTTGNTLTTATPTTATNTLSFTYTVANGDATPTTGATQVLDVTNISGFTTVTDGGANVAARYLNGVLPAAAEAKLAGNKQIKVETGDLTRSSMSFVPQSGDGIQTDDGSYWTTLNLVFNHAISKGSGDITIEQIAGSGTTAYRLPAVLTEAQYNRFRGVANLNLDTYYTKGTNGYLSGQNRSDTSTKYVLNYQWNPNSAVTTNNSAFTGDRFIPTTPTNFFTLFREAERITINVNSQAVTVDGNTLKVRLTGSNAPQVPGATYQITYLTTLVTDSLDNPCEAATNVAVTLGGVAKPFVRIRKTQDIITGFTTASRANPTVSATQPTLAYVRMDSRTPGSSVVYWAASYSYTATASNWNTTTPPTATTVARPSTTGTSSSGAGQLTIGNANHEGLKWYGVARASVGTTNSLESDEMAYRTAITYRLTGLETSSTTGQQLVQSGDHIWIRGGDSIGSSSIPGFPFTWEDNWTDLETNGKRAGIRLMTKQGTADYAANAATGGPSTENTTWQFLTWDMNATAYIDIILGLDQQINTRGGNQSSYQMYQSRTLAEVWQYGPRYWAYQRSGWSAQKLFYPIYPGEIRYLDTSANMTAGRMNFSAGFNTRPSAGLISTNPNTYGPLTVTAPNANTN